MNRFHSKIRISDGFYYFWSEWLRLLNQHQGMYMANECWGFGYDMSVCLEPVSSMTSFSWGCHRFPTFFTRSWTPERFCRLNWAEFVVWIQKRNIGIQTLVEVSWILSDQHDLKEKICSWKFTPALTLPGVWRKKQLRNNRVHHNWKNWGGMIFTLSPNIHRSVENLSKWKEILEIHPSSTSMIMGGRVTGMIGKVLEADQVDLYKGTYYSVMKLQVAHWKYQQQHLH